MNEWKEKGQMDLYYDHPASIWEETLPIGNGKLGGMIWGGVQEELIGLNEESLWSGYEREKNNPHAFDSLSEVRELVFQGKCYEADIMNPICPLEICIWLIIIFHLKMYSIMKDVYI